MRANEPSPRYGNFEVLSRPDGAPELLGGGAFGKTYKARHVFLDQIVALKVINEKFAHDANAKERFLREARVVHGLRHPHIAQVIDFGEANGTLYYAMEYCEGGSLEEMVKRAGALDPASVLLLGRQLAEALECSHRRGFLHRDVKPANVMLADRSDSLALKLVDFGLVKPLVQDHERMASLTLDGQNFFTPLFASPEQVMEEELDARSDLFSLGMTLWFLLKGTAPETGSTAVIMARRLSTESYQPELSVSLPPKLRSILQRLLEKDKADRFASATEVLAAMSSDEPVAPPVPPSLPPTPADEDHDPGATLAADPLRLADRYMLAGQTGRSAIGEVHRATRVGDGAPVSVTILDAAWRDNRTGLAKLRAAVERAVCCSHPAVVRVFGLETYEEASVFVCEESAGIALQNVVRSRGSLPFEEALAILREVAAGTDAATIAGLPGVRLTPDEIFLQPADDGPAFPDPSALLTVPLRQWPPYRVRLTPILLENEIPQDESVTVFARSAGTPTVEFGSLLYRLVAGMQVKFAARANRNAYIRTAGLSEEGNRILSECIAEEAPGAKDCQGVLLAIQHAEGVGDLWPGPVGTAARTGATTRSVFITTAGVSATRSAESVSTGPGPAPAIATQEIRRAATPTRPSEPPPSSPPTLPSQGTVRPPDRPRPWVPVLIGLAVALAILGAAAVFLLKPKPSSTVGDPPAVRPSPPAPTVAVDTPRPTSTPEPTTPVPTPTPTQTPEPTPADFVLRGDARLINARFTLDGRPVNPERRAGDQVFSLQSPAELLVTVPGYKPARLTATPDGRAELPAELTRETAAVNLTILSRESDYAFIVFTFAGALPGENVKPPEDLTYSLKSIDSPAHLELPTGTYHYTLQGPGREQDTVVQPRQGSIKAATPGRVEVAVPPTFAGRFRGEFDGDKDHARVVRTIVITPGLLEGHCDEQRTVGGKPDDPSPDNVPLADIRLDSEGVLHAHIRYTGHRNPEVYDYDEVFELRRNARGALVMTGGRETMPSDPVMRSRLEEKFRKLRNPPPMRGNRPNETELRPAD